MQKTATIDDSQSIQDSIKEFVAEATGYQAAEIGPDTMLEDIDLDSLLIVEVVVAIQRRFGVQIPPSEFRAEIRTVGDICQALGESVRRELAA